MTPRWQASALLHLLGRFSGARTFTVSVYEVPTRHYGEMFVNRVGELTCDREFVNAIFT